MTNRTCWITPVMLALVFAACDQGETPPDSDSRSDTAPVVLSYIADDGVRIEYDLRGRGSSVLVFVHGWSCDRGYWRNQVDHFADRYRVLTVDLAGHGASGGAERTDWSMAAFASDVVGIIEQEDLETVVLVGHSMGGPIAIEAAARSSDRVVAVVVVDALHDVSLDLSDDQINGLLIPFRQDFAATVDQFVRAMMFPTDADSALVSLVASDMAAADPSSGLQSFEALLRWDPQDALSRIDDPVHLINADMVPVNEDALDDDTDPDPTITYVEDVSHFLMLGHPERFNRELQKTLDVLTGNGGP